MLYGRLGQNQIIELGELSSHDVKDSLAEIAFATDDIEQMRTYVVVRGVNASKISKHMSPYDRPPYDAHFELLDPEGTRISFIQRFGFPIDDPPPEAPWYVQIIHAGFLVRDRAAEDRFYKDILGFHVYWHGGMKDDETHWVDMQVPDGTDWIEYMLNVSPNADHHTLGVMNHIALGVPTSTPRKRNFARTVGAAASNPRSAATANGSSISTIPTTPASNLWNSSPCKGRVVPNSQAPIPDHTNDRFSKVRAPWQNPVRYK